MQFAAKPVLLLFALVIGLGLWTGLFSWDHGGYKCYNGRHWMTNQRFVVFQAGRFQLNAYPYDCPTDQRYSPQDFQQNSN